MYHFSLQIDIIFNWQQTSHSQTLVPDADWKSCQCSLSDEPMGATDSATNSESSILLTGHPHSCGCCSPDYIPTKSGLHLTLSLSLLFCHMQSVSVTLCIQLKGFLWHYIILQTLRRHPYPKQLTKVENISASLWNIKVQYHQEGTANWSL